MSDSENVSGNEASPRVLPSILKSEDFKPTAPVSPSGLLGVNPPRSPNAAAKKREWEDSPTSAGNYTCSGSPSYPDAYYEPSPAVSISSYAESISPLALGGDRDVEDLDLDRVPSSGRLHRVKGLASRKLTGRPPHNSSVSSLHSITETNNGHDDDDGQGQSSEHAGSVVNQVAAWLRDEKAKHDTRRSNRHVAREEGKSFTARHRRPSNSSATSSEGVDFAKLEQIIRDGLNMSGHGKRHGHRHLRHRPSVKHLHKASSNSNVGASSDTDYFEGDVLVPSAVAWLDNSKTLAYSGGTAASESSDSVNTLETSKAHQAWADFKYEIVRITHTLRLKGWRRVPMEMSNEIYVERLSGALTNAVYVVSPPSNLPVLPKLSNSSDDKPRVQRPPPPKLLLRIYGAQVDHLIDRESELSILRRLARKRIGPRLLGTFTNGRFEEFYHAAPLTFNDLRVPETSVQIAKRMRELHDGVELLERERDEGPFVFRNWDKWVQRVEEIVSWLDTEIIKQGGRPPLTPSDAWKARGFVCGTEWSVFKDTMAKYREWLEEQYAKGNDLRSRLVFAHNDTQYGNILRLLPSGTSPLMLPANKHRQLVVIDFEYASANTPGLEFANHFTEWCYNYHDPHASYRLNTGAYPTPEEQARFVRAYVRHHPHFSASTPQLAPLQLPEAASPGILSTASSPSKNRPSIVHSSISSLMLDTPSSRTPADTPSPQTSAGVAAEEESVTALLQETRLWRLANSAQWVAWGIVQAKVPGMPVSSPTPTGTPAAEESDTTPVAGPVDGPEAAKDVPGGLCLGEGGAGTETGDRDGGTSLAGSGPESSSTATAPAAAADDAAKADTEETEATAAAEEPEFDYLAYARERALFFWGDALQLGLVREEDLPADVLGAVKMVEY